MHQECPAVVSQGARLESTNCTLTAHLKHLNQETHGEAEVNAGLVQSLLNAVKACRDNVSSKEVMGVLETIVTVALSLSLLLRSRVTPRERLRHPLSFLKTTFPFLLPSFPFLLFSLNLSLSSI